MLINVSSRPLTLFFAGFWVEIAIWGCGVFPLMMIACIVLFVEIFVFFFRIYRKPGGPIFFLPAARNISDIEKGFCFLPRKGWRVSIDWTGSQNATFYTFGSLNISHSQPVKLDLLSVSKKWMPAMRGSRRFWAVLWMSATLRHKSHRPRQGLQRFNLRVSKCFKARDDCYWYRSLS